LSIEHFRVTTDSVLINKCPINIPEDVAGFLLENGDRVSALRGTRLILHGQKTKKNNNNSNDDGRILLISLKEIDEEIAACCENPGRF